MFSLKSQVFGEIKENSTSGFISEEVDEVFSSYLFVSLL
jgi:hypothetical protein